MIPVVAGPWFRVRPVNPSLVQIDEPHVDDLLRANIWHLRGQDRDLIVDTGLGVTSLRARLPQLFERDPLVVLTHAHLDHMGGAHEFDCCWAYPGEPFAEPPPGSLHLQPLNDELGMPVEPLGPTNPILLDALPDPHFVVDDYRLRPATHINWLHDGMRIDIGDREFTVLHLPGHTPGNIGLLDDTDGTFFSGDVIYDDALIDNCVGSNVGDYCATMRRLLDLEITTVHPGHGDSFDRPRLQEIAGAYLERTTLT
jgi:glyoxylase-like metal-dependent hydrolase (beta-lactamase superfamily II)